MSIDTRRRHTCPMRLSDLKRLEYIASTLQPRHQRSSTSQVKEWQQHRFPAGTRMRSYTNSMALTVPLDGTAWALVIMNSGRLNITDTSPSWMYSLYVRSALDAEKNHKAAASPSTYKASKLLEPIWPRFAADRRSSASSCDFGPWFVLFPRKL